MGGYTFKEYNGNRFWYLNDILHREDGPAVEFTNGDKFCYLNGKLHRVDGPAIEWENGDKFWHLNGERHREDGPAIEYADGTKGWCLNDVELTKEEFTKKAKNKKFTAAEIESLKSYDIEVD
jgi:hypothetical protein